MQGGLSPEEVAALLSAQYPADKETIQRALAETIEQVHAGMAVPTRESNSRSKTGKTSL